MTARAVPDVLDGAAMQIDTRGLAVGGYCGDDGELCVLGAIASVLDLPPDVWRSHDWRESRLDSDPIELAWQAATEVSRHVSGHIARTGDTRRELVHSEVRLWSNTAAGADEITRALRVWAGLARLTPERGGHHA